MHMVRGCGGSLTQSGTLCAPPTECKDSSTCHGDEADDDARCCGAQAEQVKCEAANATATSEQVLSCCRACATHSRVAPWHIHGHIMQTQRYSMRGCKKHSRRSKHDIQRRQESAPIIHQVPPHAARRLGLEGPLRVCKLPPHDCNCVITRTCRSLKQAAPGLCAARQKPQPEPA
jgi:hypothetical protein